MVQGLHYWHAIMNQDNLPNIKDRWSVQDDQSSELERENRNFFVNFFLNSHQQILKHGTNPILKHRYQFEYKQITIHLLLH